ncbi:MAG: ABC-ATPase domain-containing protein [Bacteroidales bacterium]
MATFSRIVPLRDDQRGDSVGRIYDAERLREELSRIDGKGYKAYKDITGAYRIDEFTVFIDYVQGDPFAAPSKLRIRIDAENAGFPQELSRTRVRRVGLEDYLLRAFARALAKAGASREGACQRLGGFLQIPENNIDN